MSDEGFREIQLNGKQLVFLFMATTVVVVVIFLCGVLVGRGVRAERIMAAGDTGALTSAEVMPDQRAEKPAPSTTGMATAEPGGATPPSPPEEDLSYYKRLEGQGSPKEDLRASAERPAQVSATRGSAAAAAGGKPPKDQPAAKAVESKPAKVASGSPPAEPAGDGFEVQVAALRERSEAESIVKRLSARGYTAYVAPPAGRAASVYRVRVGKFKNRRDAELAAGRLEKEEQFKPWIIR